METFAPGEREFWVKTDLGSVLIVADDRYCFFVAGPDATPELLAKIEALLAEDEDELDEDIAYLDLSMEPAEVAAVLAQRL
jgi:hypothetical protein